MHLGRERGVVAIPLHQCKWTVGKIDTNLSLYAYATVGIDEHDRLARQRPPHRSGFDGLAWRIADERRRFRLSNPSRSVSPQASRTRLITSGFNGSPALETSRSGTRYFRGPAGSACARRWVGRERGDLAADELIEQRARVEALVLVGEHGGLRIPRREEHDQACFADPGEITLRCTSPGVMPSQYIVDKWPIG